MALDQAVSKSARTKSRSCTSRQRNPTLVARPATSNPRAPCAFARAPRGGRYHGR